MGASIARAEADRARQRKVLLIASGPRQQLVGHLAGQLRAAVPHDGVHPGLGVRVRRVALLQFARHRHARRVDVGDRHALELVAGEEIDRAPVRHGRHRQTGDGPQRLMVVERGVQRVAGLG
jgi:hypothetical protein